MLIHYVKTGARRIPLRNIIHKRDIIHYKNATYIFIHYCSCRVSNLRFRINVVDFNIVMYSQRARAHELKPDVAMSIIISQFCINTFFFYYLYTQDTSTSTHTHSNITFPPEVFPPLLTQNNNNHNNNKQYIKNKILMRFSWAVTVLL